MSLTPTLKTLAFGTMSSHLTSTSRFLSPLPYLSPCLLSSEGNNYIPEKYAKLDKKKSFYNTLLSSTIHALIVSSGTGYLLITGGLGNNPVYSKSPFGNADTAGLLFGGFYCMSTR